MPKSSRSSYKAIQVLLVALVPTVVRGVFLNINRVHGDEYILAYFASKYELLKTNVFAPVPADPAAWVSQQASVFTILQKIYLLFVGESFWAVKFSTIPYLLITAIGFYLLARLVLEKKSALIAVGLYSFFAVSLYHDTLATLHAGTNAAFIWFYYFLIKSLQKPSNSSFFMTGIFAGFCYLFDAKSYLAFPLMIIIFGGLLVYKKSKKILVGLSTAIGAFFMIMAPFIWYMIIHNNVYLLQRYHQVKLSFSSRMDIEANAVTTLRALFTNGIGGDQGFFFGHQALFEPISLLFFVVGIGLGIVMVRRRPVIGVIIFTILLTFFAGMIMTAPPPAFHRVVVTFPLIAIIMSLPFEKILSRKNLLTYSIVGLLLVIYSANNLIYFSKAAEKDGDVSVKLARYIERNFPNREVSIVAFPQYHVQKVFYFSQDNGLHNSVLDYPNNLLVNFDASKRYLYIVPEMHRGFENEIQSRDGRTQIMQFGEFKLVSN